jgi:hypothetical protein
MFHGAFNVHSVAGDLWVQFGIAGLLFASVMVIALARASLLNHESTSSGIKALCAFLFFQGVWDLLFSPLDGNFRNVGFATGVALFLIASGRDRPLDPEPKVPKESPDNVSSGDESLGSGSHCDCQEYSQGGGPINKIAARHTEASQLAGSVHIHEVGPGIASCSRSLPIEVAEEFDNDEGPLKHRNLQHVELIGCEPEFFVVATDLLMKPPLEDRRLMRNHSIAQSESMNIKRCETSDSNHLPIDTHDAHKTICPRPFLLCI